ncbi:ribose/xylose/arabinose/galactoside ABC-type transport system permease subunit [Nocardioides ginsengisegetis]|uniref:Ribose/xylose/arabinose/galactoside ABC-type transport system permease subunit n=1 Tax=Nocardioides ginsengisegetis TaxID=661491 RepID=A0A7W3P9B6_9ACTN|nr:ABC transporter permease [Nocardioides ginsengisegetis]MBA8803279.1 ribose/xylose/arabinose/galactoside ABC-type transport system permease subunit [Nocardioides ginsengisegetis]
MAATRTPELLIAGIAGAVLVYGAATTEGFLSPANFKAIFAGVGILGIVAVGMTFVTLSGSLFCLTLGTTLTVSSMGFLTWLQFGVVPAILLTLLLGAVIGLGQGILVGGLGANPIIVTIGFGALQLGVASKLTNSAAVYPPGDSNYAWLASTIAGLPVAVYVLVLLVLISAFWLAKSTLGQTILLVGENQSAARAAGLPVVKAITAAFVIAGGCAALGGVLLGATDGNATLLSGGDRYTYDAIAAVLVGGVAASGGRGTVQQTVLGALLIAVISDMLLLRGASGGVQLLVTGAVVIVVLVFFQLRGHRS